MEKELVIHYHEYAGAQELLPEDRALLQSAVAATATAYSPYSHFRVGAALRLADGTVETGSNQENIAYPSGLCAERTVMFGASSRHPDVAFHTLAIVGREAQGQLVPATPCGACRQVMAEYETRFRHPLRILLYSNGGKILLFDEVKSLLPFLFTF